MTRVTVVTPTLDSERFLVPCLESVAGQRGPGVDVEHVVVDGGSRDRTVEIAEAHGARVLTGRDRSLYDAMNKGAAVAGGELLGFLGSDDLLLPGALATVTAAYRRGSRRWLIGGLRWVDADGSSLGDLVAPPSWLTTEVLASPSWCVIGHQATYVAADLFHELGGFLGEWRYSADWELHCRARRREPFTRIGEVIAGFRRRPDQSSASPDPVRVEEDRAVMERYGPSSPARRFAYQLALRAWLNARSPRWFLGKHRPGRQT